MSCTTQVIDTPICKRFLNSTIAGVVRRVMIVLEEVSHDVLGLTLRV